MAADLPPATFQQWTFEKAQSHGSPASDRSSTDFSDAEDKLRISPNMEEIKATIAEKDAPFLNKEYLSSEEALSPVIDEGESEEEELEEEDLELESFEAELWEEIKVFALDIAITLSMQSVGRPKVVELQSPYNPYPAALRFDSPPRSIPPRNERRVTQLRIANPELSTKLSESSMNEGTSTSASSFDDSSATLHSRFSGSSCAESPTTAVHSDDVQDSSSFTESSKSSRRNGSIFSIANNSISTSWTPPLSDQSSVSTSPSFLQSDPFETTITPKPTHSRLRSISTKISNISFKKEVKSDEEKATSKHERRSSLSFFDGVHSRRNSISRPPTAQQPAILAPPQTTPTQRVFPKMVARGANERAPPICLPDCPDEYDTTSPPELLFSNRLSPIKRKNVASSISNSSMRRRRSLLGFG